MMRTIVIVIEADDMDHIAAENIRDDIQHAIDSASNWLLASEIKHIDVGTPNAK